MEFPHLRRLLDTLQRLRGPDGCPWDRQQTPTTAARYLADEVHEYADAVASGDAAEARGELADLLYMVAFNWLLLAEAEPFAFDELARAGTDKLVRRHPHVFGEATAETAEDSQILWLQEKARERHERGDEERPPTLLKDLAPSVSPLRQADLYGKGAAEGGFDWRDAQEALQKVREELAELVEVLPKAEATRGGSTADGSASAAALEELGDLLFATVQLGRKLGLDPDTALRRANRKFARRFRRMEREIEGGAESMRTLGRTELIRRYRQAKTDESSA